jgi:DNA-binding XRE family transcriptional regulator
MPNRQGNRLRELRHQYGWTLRALAHRVGVSHETIRSLELNGLQPGTDRDTAWGVADTFGLTIEQLWPEALELENFHPTPERAIPFTTPEAAAA